MTDTNIYLGRPGALAAIRSPRGTFEAPRVRRVSAFELGAGGVSVDQMVGGARTYTINYEMLNRDDWTTLQGYLDGLEGPGPFALLDPGQRNMLPANISGATSVTNSLDGGPTGGFDILGVSEDYNRTPVASGWSTAPTGQTWVQSGGIAANYNVANGVGTIAHTTTGTIRTMSIDTGYTDFDFYADVSFDVGTPTGAAITQWMYGRFADSSNYYQVLLQVSTAGVVTMQLGKRVAGSLTGIGSVYTFSGTHSINQVWRVHFQGIGGSTIALKASAWPTATAAEPTSWLIEQSHTDAALTSGTSIAVSSRVESGNTNPLPVTFTYHRVVAAPMVASGSSSTAYTDAGPRVLGVNFSAAPSGTAPVTIGMHWPSSTFDYGIPVVTGRAICFSCYVRGGGTDAITTWTPKIIWRDASKYIISTTTSGSGAVTSSSGAWAQMYATGTPPANTVYADFYVGYTSGATSGAVAYFRRFMVNEGSTPDTTWAAGTGVWPVRFISLPEAWPFLSPELRSGPVATLLEDVS